MTLEEVIKNNPATIQSEAIRDLAQAIRRIVTATIIPTKPYKYD